MLELQVKAETDWTEKKGVQTDSTTYCMDKTQRLRCHHRCLIATVPDKIHKVWPLAITQTAQLWTFLSAGLYHSSLL